jgi:hypothetical protein
MLKKPAITQGNKMDPWCLETPGFDNEYDFTTNPKFKTLFERVYWGRES